MSKQNQGERGDGSGQSGDLARFGGEARSGSSHPFPGRTFLAILLCVALTLCASVVLMPLGVAQGDAAAHRAGKASQSKAVVASARNAALLVTTASVLRETSKIRELSILRQVKSSSQSRAEIQRMIIKNLNEEITPAETHATEITWKQLGMAPADFQFRQFLIQLLTEQVAGYYDPKSKQFYLADWIDPEAQKPVMAHELTHALQDQHFNLRRFENWAKGDSDAELAAHALIEGDASLAMELYIADNPLRALSFLKSITAGMAATEQLDRAPRALRESLLFPYFEGRVWAKELYKRGGWSRVSRAFTELPASSEQILHVDKYLAREAPVKVTLPDVAPLLNANAAESRSEESGTIRSLQPPPSSLWKRVDYDVNGEWNYYLILDQYLKSPDESKRAAAGWAGDRYEVFEGPGGEVILAMLSVWDTENDAREFFDAYVKRTERRYPGAERAEFAASDKLPAGAQRRWRTSEGLVVMTLRGPRVLVLEGLPAQFDAQRFVKTLGQ